MAREFTFPAVPERRPFQPGRGTPLDTRQRALVAASLILCPRDANSKAADR